MAIRQQPRRTARILALLSLSQVRGKLNKSEDIGINDLLLGAIRTLSVEIESAIENASDELNRSNDQLLKSETRTNDLNASRNMLKEAIALTQKAINSMGSVLEIPEFVRLSNQEEVRKYAIELITTVLDHQEEIDGLIKGVMVDWSLKRLTQIDATIIRLAVAEMACLKLDPKIAINEAVDIAKQYSDDDGYRFINGVLRKVSNKLIKMAAT